nr:hypothetical protein [Rhodococcus ruber]
MRSDTRPRRTADGRTTVAALAAAEALSPPPTVPYPAILTESRVVSRQALVSYRGNRYSVPPELASAQVTVTRVLGSEVIDIVTTSQITIARHRLAPDGAGVMVRDHGHVLALEQVAMAAAGTGGRPHRRKERIPPGPEAIAAARKLRTSDETTTSSSGDSEPTPVPAASTVIDLSTYERAARGRNTLA